jgi:hypothetical protein
MEDAGVCSARERVGDQHHGTLLALAPIAGPDQHVGELEGKTFMGGVDRRNVRTDHAHHARLERPARVALIDLGAAL